MRLTFLSKGALKKTVTRFRGPDRPWRRPRRTCRFARGLGPLLSPAIIVPPPLLMTDDRSPTRFIEFLGFIEFVKSNKPNRPNTLNKPTYQPLATNH